MLERTVLTAIGSDRPGLVEEVAEFVFTRGGSIEDSRMANLRGQFAIVMLVAGSGESLARLEGDLAQLAATEGIRVELTPAAPNELEAVPRLPYRLTGRALDQPGLVHQLANLLRSFGVNIESLETTLEAAPVTGAPVFAMEIVVVAVPHDASLAKLRDELARVCDALNVDWTLSPLSR
jgi:glycine cleavage system transcriptional repressor